MVKMRKTWRQHCAPIIASVIAENKGLNNKELRAKIREAYPYGERAMHPYKIWCDEVKKQLARHFSKNAPAVQTGLFAQ